MLEMRHELQAPSADAAAYRPRIGVDVVNECAHTGVAQSVAELVGLATSDARQPIELRAYCPDCWRELDIRLWLPEAGGWHLRLQERLAAARTWILQIDSERHIGA